MKISSFPHINVRTSARDFHTLRVCYFPLAHIAQLLLVFRCGKTPWIPRVGMPGRAACRADTQRSPVWPNSKQLHFTCDTFNIANCSRLAWRVLLTKWDCSMFSRRRVSCKQSLVVGSGTERVLRSTTHQQYLQSSLAHLMCDVNVTCLTYESVPLNRALQHPRVITIRALFITCATTM